MTPAELIAQITKLGGRLYLDEGQLRLKAPKGLLTDELRARLKDQKQGLIDFLSAAQSADIRTAAAIEPVPRAGPMPVSFSQQRLWFLEELEPGGSTWNMPWSLRLRGELNQAALQAAVDALVKRHESLRTCFDMQGDETVQIISDDGRVLVEQTEQNGLSDTQIHAWLAEKSSLSFDLRKGSLLRIHVLQTAPDDFRLLIVIHHIISDAWSMSVLFQELAMLYAAHCQQQNIAWPELPLQYADFAVWQRGWFQDAQLERQINFWRKTLADAPPLLELPTDRPRPVAQTYAGEHVKISAGPELLRKLQAVAQPQGVSMFMLLKAALDILLARYAGTEDIVIGTPVAGRQHAELESLIGFFLNTLVLRSDLSGNPGFTEYLGQVRRTTLAAFEHQDLPFEKLVEELRPERELSHSPVFQVLFNLRAQTDDAFELHGLDVDFDVVERTTAKLDLALSIDESRNGLELEFEYNTDLFDRSSIEEMARAYVNLLRAIAANPASAIGDLNLLDPADLQQRLDAVQAARPDNAFTPFPDNALAGSVISRFEAVVANRNAELAAETERFSWTYKELNEQANKVAHALRGSCPEGGQAGLLMSQDVPMLAGMLGILKAGMAYVPLDAEAPEVRLQQICTDARLSVIVTDALHRDQTLQVCGGGIDLLEVVPDADGITENTGIEIQPDALAYILFTSGSTGTPKGVMQNHRNVLHHCRTYTNAIHIDAADRLSLLPHYGFDAAVMDIFGALLNGATLMPYDLRTATDPAAVLRAMAEQQLTVFHSTPTVLRYLLEAAPEQSLESMRLVVLGGEEARSSDFQIFCQRFPAHAVFVNGLGPSESTLALQYFAHRDSRLPGVVVPVGQAVANTEILLLDAAGLPTGISGELAISSAYTTPGYWNDPQQTAAAFISIEGISERIYRTGDQARYLPDGQLVFIGRKDAQIKLRGHRIEAGEIEAALLEQSVVQNCAVLLLQDKRGADQLVAYLTAAEALSLDVAQLRHLLRDRLPAYMVPAAYVVIDDIPLTANGKLDRRALPAPEWEAEAEFMAPRTPTEEALASIWAEVLGVDRVGINDDFFALGGHSLLATQLIARVREHLQLEPSLRAVFETPTVAGFAESLEEAGASVADPDIGVCRRDIEIPQSFAQQRLWFLDQLGPGSSAYHLSQAVRLDGKLDMDALRTAVAAFVHRHETLRTSFADGDTGPIQVIAAHVEIPLAVEELPGADDAAINAKLTELSNQPFDLAAGPLMRLHLLRLSDDSQILVMVIHHIISDMWSLNLLWQDLTGLYNAALNETTAELPELPLQYADYSVWQRDWLSGAGLERQLGYWRDQLVGAPALLELPTDRPRPAVQTYNGDFVTWSLTGDTPAALRKLAGEQGGTMFMVLLAAFNTLLSRYTGSEDIVVGTPIAGRRHKEFENLIGFFVNTLVLRNDLSDNPGFIELLQQVKLNTLDAYDHQDLPFEKLVDELQPVRDLSHSPLFQVNFILQNAPGGPAAFEVMDATGLMVEHRQSKFDLTLACTESSEGIGGLFEFNTDLFDRSTIERMRDHFICLLESIAAEPACGIHDLRMLGEAEERQLLLERNATGFDYPADLTVHAMFEHQVAAHPEAPALWADGKQLSYGELNRRANQLAQTLQEGGVRPGVLVAISIERTADMIVGLLGILKAGGAYVPLDPQYPLERVTYMLEDCAAPVLLSQTNVAAELSGTSAKIICLDTYDWTNSANAEVNPASGVRPEDLAYVIYTSGSTGKPKGVCIEHRNTIALMQWAGDAFAAEEFAGVLASTSVCFDLSVFEIFCTLGLGGRIVLVENALALPELPAEAGVTLINTVPSAIAELIRTNGIPASVRTVNLAGEPLTTALADDIYATGVANVNDLYGPSEDTTYSTWTRREPGEAPTIGVPVHNTQAYLLDAYGHLVPDGAIGELYLGGSGVTRGYLHRPELTHEKYVPDTFSGQPGGRLYRTGDQARYRADGKLQFLGRIDQQIKLRGFRIELGEIEAALDADARVEQSLVMVREDSPGDKKLVAYISFSGARPETQELREELQTALPDYMVPAAFVMLNEFPLLPNGKINRNALPVPKWQAEEDYVAPRTATEKALAEIWAGLLRLERVGIHDNFFELGGDSILSIRIISRAAQSGLHLMPKQVFSHQTIASLAEVVGTGVRIDAEQGLINGAVSLSPIEEWFLEFDSPNPHHFNQSLMLQIDAELSADTLQQALQSVFLHHDALRLRFIRTGGAWKQDLDVSDVLPELQTTSLVDQVDEAARNSVISTAADLTQGSIDIGSGCLMANRLFVTGAGESNLLLMVVHHLGVDGVSWGILVEDLETACRQIIAAESVKLPEKTTSFKAWNQKWQGYLAAGELDDELDYWQAVVAANSALPVDKPDGKNSIAASSRLTLELDADLTRQLLQEVPAAYKTRINDVLLTALARALRNWTGCRHYLIDLEGHGREHLFDEADVSRTVGWFTTKFPVQLDLSDAADEGANLKEIKERLREIPNNGIGYGFLEQSGVIDAHSFKRPQIVFNYLGQFGGSDEHDEPSLLGPSDIPGGLAQGADRMRPHLIDINCSVNQGQLIIGITYGTEIFDETTIKSFAEALRTELTGLIKHCIAPGSFGRTPSDFPLCNLDQSEVDRLSAGGRNIDDIYPATAMQHGIQFHSIYEADRNAYLSQVMWTLECMVDTAAFARAWQLIVNRHAALRTSIMTSQAGQPLQVVSRDIEVPLGYVDWSELPEDEVQQKLMAFLEQDRVERFDLDRPPLIRLNLFRVRQAEYRFVWTYHHIVIDGWSIPIVIDELMATYQAFVTGRQPRLAESRPFGDYVAWLSGQEYSDAEAFWQKSLAGLTAPTELPAAQISYNPALGQGEYAAQGYALSEEVTEGLKEFARQHRLTLNTLAQGVWSILLSRYSADEYIIFGATTSGRPADLRNVESMVGLLINALPIATPVPAGQKTVEWLAALQEQQLNARQYEYVSLVEVQGWSDVPRGIPLFNTLLVFENYPRVTAMWSPENDALVMTGKHAIEWTNYPLTLALSIGECFNLRLEYDRHYYDDATVEQIGEHFLALLKGIVAEPECRVGALPMLNEAERHRLLVEWNDTGFDYPAGLTVHSLFEARVAEQPDAIALLCGGLELSYGELNRRANRLAATLNELGIGRGDLVGISVDRNEYMITGLLAILKSGAAYVPLDPKYPPDRVAFMLDDSKAPVLLTQETLREHLPGHSAQPVCLDTYDWGSAEEQLSNAVSGVQPNDLAYVIYTSGSTGIPKGVAIEHRNTVALIQWAGDVFAREQFDGVLASTSVCFDLSVFEIFCTLGIGGRIVLVENALGLPELPATANVTLINTVPSAAAELVRMDGIPETVTTVNLAGEPLTTALADSIYALGNIRHVNDLYGPSEDTTYSTWTRRIKGAPPTIGRPVHNTQVYLLDPEGNPVPVGVPGELFLGGAGVTRGYLNRPELTAEKYLADPFAKDENARLYRTGDRARYRPDSNIEFLGRLDYQVKLRGFRIELGEIETRIEEHDAVEQALVIVREDSPGDQRLVAYLVASVQNLEREQIEKWEAEQVSQWEDLWQDTYSDKQDVEPGSDFSGWISSYSGEPIPVDEMIVWIDSTAERINALKASRILEIGSGTGLVASRVTPQCDHYLATDFSPAVMSTLAELKDSRDDLGSLNLRQCRADELTDIKRGSYDAVIINSVAQYFPDAEYFAQTLLRAVDMLADGGHIFLGDLRSLPLLDAYHSSVQLFKANDSLSVANLAGRIRQRIDEEEELLIDPAIFAALQRAEPRISGVRFQLKRGTAHNELTRFRYDVVIEVGGVPQPAPNPEIVDWQKSRLTVVGLDNLLRENSGNGLLLRNIPDAKLAQDAYAMERFVEAADRSVAALRADIASAELQGFEAEELYELMLANNWDVQLLALEAGSYDALCRPAGSVQSFDGLRLVTAGEADWHEYTNDPLRGRLARSLEPLLRSKIKADLPEYMMPSAFMIMEEFPLTPNGKIDRKKLPAPEWRPQKEYVAPRTPVEEQLAEIWAVVLRLERIGIHDDFFALGGHSLLAMQLVSRIRDVYSVDIPLVTLFRNPTVAAMANQVDAGDVEEIVAIAPRDHTQPAPMSFAQQRMWFLEEMEPGPTYNVPWAVKLEGLLDMQAFQRAFDALVAQHESLRTTFCDSNDGPIQIIADELHIPVEQIDLRGADGESVRTRLNELWQINFDLKQGPLVRLSVLHTGPESCVLLLCMHHIICDNWSVSIIYRDLEILYEGYRNNEPVSLPLLPLQYSDYTLWQQDLLNGGELDRQLEYWKQQLGDAPPLLNLPLDKVRPSVETHTGASERLQLDKALVDALNELARSSGCTLFALVLTVFNILLHRYSTEDDLVVGTPISGRRRSEFEGVVGFFLNTLAIRSDTSGNPGFSEMLERTRQSTLDAFTHQDIPFEKLVEELQPERNRSHAPIFQVLFVLNPLSPAANCFGNLDTGPVDFDFTGAKFDLQLTVSESEDGLHASMLYNVDLFEQDSIRRMLGHFRMFLEAVVADPHQAIDDLPMLSHAERIRILDEFNATGIEFPVSSVVELVEAQIASKPEAVAIQSGADSLSYSELNSRANNLALALIEKGVGSGTRVGVCAERSIEVPVAVLGILKTGAAYVPVDPGYPPERVAFMLEDSKMQVLLTQSHLRDDLPGHEAETICLDEFDWNASGASGASDARADIVPDSPVYVIYTSGSTGQPKGTILTHLGLANLLQWQQTQSGLDHAAKTLQFASFSFDVSFQEMFSTWSQGGTLVMIDDDMRRDLPVLAHFINTEQVERLFLPFAAFQPLVECILDAGLETSLKISDVIVAGEQLKITPPIRRLFMQLSGARLHNHYGPSETHVVTAFTLDGDPDVWPALPPIGKPVANTQAYVFDEALRPLPVGVPGELYIAGVQVGLGYLGRAELTREKFISDPIGHSDARFYRTGDRVRYLSDGALEYLGRTDDQLKWRGFRIEPGEIEAVLAANEQVRQASVLLRDDDPEDKRLVAYIIAEEGDRPDTVFLRAYMKERLPEYMVPSNFVLLDDMPLTPSGKINRRALPAPEIIRSKGEEGAIPRSDAEKNIARIWQFLLKVDAVYREDNFFDLGGHSLLTIKFVNKVRDATGEQMSIADVFENPTLEELSKLLDDADWDMAAIGLSGSGLIARVRRAIAGMFGLN